MKIIKSLTLTLLAFASVSLGGCTTDKTEYEPGTDNKGAQAYFAATTTAFSVRTAEEKQESYEEAAALVNRVATRAGFEDDKEVSIYLSRKNTSGTATVNVTVSFSASAEDLFEVEGAGDAEYSADGKSVVYTVPVAFAADADTAPITVSFDIAELEENATYSFSAALENEADGSLYASPSATFSISHLTEQEGLPFVNIGEITVDYEWYWELDPHSGVKIQLHKDDLNAWMLKNNVTSFTEYGTGKEIKADAAGAKEYRKTLTGQEYLRVFIPKFMYQLVAAAEAEEAEDIFELGFDSYEEAYDYFEDCDGLLLNMSLEYEPVADYSNGYELHPVVDEKMADVLGTTSFSVVLPYMTGINDAGNVHGTFYSVDPSVPTATTSFHIGAYYSNGSPIDVWFNFGTSTVSQSTNKYTYTPYYYVSGLGGWGANPISFTWDVNDLEEDWDNYFSVDYNNDILYATVGTGSLQSQYYGNVPEESDDEADDEEDDDVEVIERTLYKGYNDILKTSVYYMADAYADGYGLAIEYDGKAKVAANQPLGIVLFGKEMFASQSSTYSSKVEFAANGAVSKVVFGIVLHDADGREYVEFEETLVFEESKASVKDFIGTFEMVTTEIYSDMFEYVGPEEGDEEEEGSWEQVGPGLDYFVSTVTITLDPENSTKVYISGLIPYYYLYGEDGTLEGTYDVTANCIVIPAQYFNKPAWDLGYGFDLFPYFQPGETDYDYYIELNEDGTDYDYETAYWYSTMGTEAPAAALYLDEDGSLYMGSSPTDGSGVAVDGFAVNLHYYDAQSGEFEDLGELFSTFGYYGMYTPTFTPVEYPLTRASAAPAKKSLNFSGQLKKVDISEAKTAKRVAIKR